LLARIPASVVSERLSTLEEPREEEEGVADIVEVWKVGPELVVNFMVVVSVIRDEFVTPVGVCD